MMRPLRVLAAIGDITRLYSLTLLVPIAAALVYDERNLRVMGSFHVPYTLMVFLATAGVMALYWVPLHFLAGKIREEELQDREAYLTVALGWLFLTAFSALPFLLSGMFRNPVDALFEAMSGLTTTGATVLTSDYAQYPRSVMLWRQFLQYLGGMGIIVLSVALLARLSHGGHQLLQAEVPGPSVVRIRPKLAQVARTLWRIYLVFSALLFAIYLLILVAEKGYTFSDAAYDALAHTFTTMSTGGFSTHAQSIAAFDSWIFEAVCIVFMLIAASNFTLHYYLLHGDWRRLLRDAEWRFFMASFALSSLVITGLVWHAGDHALQAARGAVFTTASILTSTGYGTVDFAAYPAAAQILLLVMMLTGATAGSTSGGLKHVRILLLFKLVRRQIVLLQHPRAVVPIRLGGRVLKEETITTTMTFFFLFVTFALFGSVFLAATDPLLGLVDAVSAGASAMGNTGPALGVLGPTETYAPLLDSSKAVIAFMMWVGRLEVFAVLLLFAPSSWKK